MTVIVPDIGLGCANLLYTELPEFIDVAERAGFHRITVRPHAFLQARKRGWTDEMLAGRLVRAGIEVTMIDALTTALPGRPLSSDLDPDLRSRLPIDVIDPPDEVQCFDAASTLGASIVNVTHYLGRSQPRNVMAVALAGVCRRAAPLGLQISLEFFPDCGLPDIAFAQSVIEACGEANASLLLDVFHLDRSGGTVDDIRRLPPGAIAGIQLSDRLRPSPGTPHVPFGGRLLPGEGELPLRELVEAALENSPPATLDIEVLNEEMQNLSPQQTADQLAAAATVWRATIG
jgi:sugar phosphate isomerase/epimerase